MTNSKGGVLGMFPELDGFGGIQASARVACSVLARPRYGGRHVFCYRPRNNAVVPDVGDVYVRTKIGAVAAVLCLRRPVRMVVVWHLGLLKLVPLLGVPRPRVAVFLHGIEAWRPGALYSRLVLKHVDLFLTNSGYTWERFVTAHPECRSAPHCVVPLGIGNPVDTVREPDARPSLLMLGRASRSEGYKGHREMIAAWPRILSRIPDACLQIAGPGDSLDDFRKQTSDLHLNNSVRILGAVTEEEKQELLLSCRAMALPSRGEGFGIVYLEAMRLGRPCLVSTLDAGREVVNPPEAGCAADPSDAELLADAVCRLLTPGPDWVRWSQQARQRYESGFTEKHFQSRLHAAFGGLLS